jgi:FkbM family methyltransferase
MIRPHHPRPLNRLGKSLAPLLTRAFMRGPLVQAVPLLETYLAIIQGKGSGTGWDLQGEVNVAVSHIHRPDAVILDVGANTGDWSVHLLQALGSPQCRIIQIEPSAHCCSILRALDLPQATCIEAAVGDRPGIATLYSPEPGSALASLYPRRDSYHQSYTLKEEKVKVVTIDGVIADFGIDVVDFLKLDVEGHELAALHGAQESLVSRRIKALTFEFGSGNINSRTFFHDFWDMLSPLGYTIKRMCPGGILIPIEEYYEDLEYFRGVSNYLAVLE